MSPALMGEPTIPIMSFVIYRQAIELMDCALVTEFSLVLGVPAALGPHLPSGTRAATLQVLFCRH